MARPRRRSLLITETKPMLHSSESNSDQCDDRSPREKDQSEHQLKKRTSSLSGSDGKSSSYEIQENLSQNIEVKATPPRPPMRSLPISTSSPPLIRSLSKTQRMGRFSQFLQNEAKIDNFQRHSVAEMSIHTDYNKIFSSDSNKNLDTKDWISSPVFTEGQAVVRKRKQSVFGDNHMNEQIHSNEELMEDNYTETIENI